MKEVTLLVMHLPAVFSVVPS